MMLMVSRSEWTDKGRVPHVISQEWIEVGPVDGMRLDLPALGQALARYLRHPAAYIDAGAQPVLDHHVHDPSDISSERDTPRDPDIPTTRREGR
jgi:hypothetical protein